MLFNVVVHAIVTLEQGGDAGLLHGAGAGAGAGAVGASNAAARALPRRLCAVKALIACFPFECFALVFVWWCARLCCKMHHACHNFAVKCITACHALQMLGRVRGNPQQLQHNR